MKKVERPNSMQRALAQEAEALGEERARQIKTGAEVDAAKLLQQAAQITWSALPAWNYAACR